MSSKRGRKRNDNLPPNRARDVQRAFRARRAAHLQALEQRVAELEEENNCLRMALRLPLSTRPPLGKGPTGKDKIKAYDGNAGHPVGFNTRGSSAENSPGSRASTNSPPGIGVSMSSSAQPMTVIDSNWNDSLLMNDHQHPTQHTDEVSNSSEMTYHITPMTAPMSAPLAVKPLQYSYNGTFASSSRSLSSNVYSGSPAPYSHSSDRPMGSNYGSQNFVRGEIRDESRQQYPYPQSFTPHDSNAHSQTPSPGLHAHSYNLQSSRESSLPYPTTHRRSVTDPQGYSIAQGFSHLPNPPPPQQQQPRPPDYMRQIEIHTHEMHNIGQSSRSGPYNLNGRLDPLP